MDCGCGMLGTPNRLTLWARPRSWRGICHPFRSLDRPMREYRQLAEGRIEEAYHRFYGEGGVYHYSQKLAQSRFDPGYPTLFKNALEVFAACVYSDDPVVFRDAQQVVSRGARIGMACLVHPDGTCLTALGCVKNASHCYVHFPRNRDGKVFYKCKVTKLGLSLALLKPIKKRQKSFDGCIASGMRHWTSSVIPQEVGTFGKYADGKFDFCTAMTLEKFNVQNYPYRPKLSVKVISGTMLPSSPVLELGSPVMNPNGTLRGIVTKIWKVINKPSERHGIDRAVLSYLTVRDFHRLLDDVQIETDEGLLSSKTPYECLKTGLETGQLVEFAAVLRAFKTPHEEWIDQHPLTMPLYKPPHEV